MPIGQHPFQSLLRHQEAAERADRDRLGDIGGDQIDERAACPGAGIVDHEVGRGDLALDEAKQPLDVIGSGGVAGKRLCPGLAAERAKLFAAACGERDADAFTGQQPRQRCTEALAGADNQSGLVVRLFHLPSP